MTDPAIHVAAAVRFLELYKPAMLAALRRDNPDESAQAVLQPEGAVLGGGDVALDAALAAAEAFLGEIDGAALAAIAGLRRRLTLAQYVELGGKLLALASSGTLITVLLSGSGRTLAILLASVGFLAAAIPLIVAFMRGSLTDPTGLQKQYATLRDASIGAALLRNEIAAAKAAKPRDAERLAALIARANDLARTSFEILSDLGYDIRPGRAGG